VNRNFLYFILSFLPLMVTFSVACAIAKKDAQGRMDYRCLRWALRFFGMMGLFATGFYGDLVFRRSSNSAEDSVARGLLFGSLVGGVAGFMAACSIGRHPTALQELRGWSFVGLVFFGFQWWWENGLEQIWFGEYQHTNLAAPGLKDFSRIKNSVGVERRLDLPHQGDFRSRP
jgi:hypothetical protein